MFTRVHAAGRRHTKTKKAHGLARAGPEGNPILLIIICLWCANGELGNPGEGVLGPRPMAAGQRKHRLILFLVCEVFGSPGRR